MPRNMCGTMLSSLRPWLSPPQFGAGGTTGAAAAVLVTRNHIASAHEPCGQGLTAHAGNTSHALAPATSDATSSAT